MDVDLDALNEYFTFQNIFSYNTLFKGANMLPPANRIEITKESKFIKHNSWGIIDFTKKWMIQCLLMTQKKKQKLFLSKQ